MSTRALILAAIEAAGVRAHTTGQFAAPCVIVEAGDPWAAVDLSLGKRRTTRWRLTIVAGRADSEAALDTLAGMVDTVDDALLTIPGAQLPTWAQPFDASLGAVPYAATAVTIQLLSPEG
jgi:hypothetical protein